ncbi:hypothetical protein [Paracoccus marcusii]|uniref:hypothetical protein n=1 Tax=Paracoccus marcusii TaxID=59779 RepID=UPI0035A6B4F9
MARELIKTTREDATGFHKPKKPARESILKPLDESAVNAFAQKRQRIVDKPSAENMRQSEQPTSIDTPEVPAAEESLPPSPRKNVDTARTAEMNKVASKHSSAETTNELVDLVVPPRDRETKALPLTLRLRVLKRHVAPLVKLQSAGLDVEDLMKAALSRLPTINFEPRYVAQVAEPSGAGGWGCRLNTRIKPETLEAIQAQVRGGATAPRSKLLLGQVEPLWFSSLDQAIKDFSK